MMNYIFPNRQVFLFFGKLQHYKQTQHDDMTGLCVDSTLNLLRTAQRGFGRMNGVIGLSLLQTSTLLTASSIPCYVKPFGDSLKAHSEHQIEIDVIQALFRSDKCSTTVFGAKTN